MKMILIFLDGELLQSITYKTKREAWGNYMLFKKWGLLDGQTGLTIPNCKFELI